MSETAQTCCCQRGFPTDKYHPGPFDLFKLPIYQVSNDDYQFWPEVDWYSNLITQRYYDLLVSEGVVDPDKHTLDMVRTFTPYDKGAFLEYPVSIKRYPMVPDPVYDDRFLTLISEGIGRTFEVAVRSWDDGGVLWSHRSLYNDSTNTTDTIPENMTPFVVYGVDGIGNTVPERLGFVSIGKWESPSGPMEIHWDAWDYATIHDDLRDYDQQSQEIDFDITRPHNTHWNNITPDTIDGHTFHLPCHSTPGSIVSITSHDTGGGSRFISYKKIMDHVTITLTYGNLVSDGTFDWSIASMLETAEYTPTAPHSNVVFPENSDTISYRHFRPMFSDDVYAPELYNREFISRDVSGSTQSGWRVYTVDATTGVLNLSSAKEIYNCVPPDEHFTQLNENYLELKTDTNGQWWWVNWLVPGSDFLDPYYGGLWEHNLLVDFDQLQDFFDNATISHDDDDPPVTDPDTFSTDGKFYWGPNSGDHFDSAPDPHFDEAWTAWYYYSNIGQTSEPNYPNGSLNPVKSVTGFYVGTGLDNFHVIALSGGTPAAGDRRMIAIGKLLLSENLGAGSFMRKTHWYEKSGQQIVVTNAGDERDIRGGLFKQDSCVILLNEGSDTNFLVSNPVNEDPV